jgi:predicted phosphoribosyltransferase
LKQSLDENINTIILVDDGAASGATVTAAARSVRRALTNVVLQPHSFSATSVLNVLFYLGYNAASCLYSKVHILSAYLC